MSENPCNTDQIWKKLLEMLEKMLPLDKILNYLDNIQERCQLSTEEYQNLRKKCISQYSKRVIVLGSASGEENNLEQIIMADRFISTDIDYLNRVIYMNPIEVNEMLASKIVKALFLLDSLAQDGDKPIKLLMNCVGGDVYDGLAIYDAIKLCKNEVWIIVLGQAFSMGAWILQASKRRIISANARLMIHVGYTASPRNHPEINKLWQEQYDRDDTLCNQILHTRIMEKHNNNETSALLTIKKFLSQFRKDDPEELSRIETIENTKQGVKELVKFDSIFNAEESIELGLADEILTNFALIRNRK